MTSLQNSSPPFLTNTNKVAGTRSKIHVPFFKEGLLLNEKSECIYFVKILSSLCSTYVQNNQMILDGRWITLRVGLSIICNQKGSSIIVKVLLTLSLLNFIRSHVKCVCYGSSLCIHPSFFISLSLSLSNAIKKD